MMFVAEYNSGETPAPRRVEDLETLKLFLLTREQHGPAPISPGGRKKSKRPNGNWFYPPRKPPQPGPA